MKKLTFKCLAAILLVILAMPGEFVFAADAPMPRYQSFVGVETERWTTNRTILNDRYYIFSVEDPASPGRFLEGLRDIDGNVVIPAIYRFLRADYFLRAQNQQGYWGVIDLRGTVIIPFIANGNQGGRIDPLNFSVPRGELIYRVTTAHGEGTGIKNIHGQYIVQPIFSEIRVVGESLFGIRPNQSDLPNVLMNFSGIVVTEIDRRYNLNFFGGVLFASSRDVAFSNFVMSPTGERLVNLGPLRPEATDGRFLVLDDGNALGVIDIRGKGEGTVLCWTNRQVLPFIHTDIRLAGDGIFIVATEEVPWGSDRGVWGVTDIYRNVIIPNNYWPQDLQTIMTLRRGPRNFIRENFSNAQRVHWFDTLRGQIGTQELMILCTSTGNIVRARSFANGNHADVRGITAEYHAMIRGEYGGFQNVLVSFGNTVTPATLWGPWYPSDWPCLHFYGSTQNNDGRSLGTRHIEEGERISAMIYRYVRY